MSKTLDEKIKNLKSAKVYEGVTACNKLLLERDRRVQTLNGEHEGLVKHAQLPLLKAERGDSITVPGLGVPGEAELRQLMEDRQIPSNDELLRRAVPWFGSDERVDGDGDIVRQNWDFEDFKDNSPMPFSHKWEQPPVGRVIDWKVVQRNDADYSGPALWLLCMFATAEEWEFADSVFRLVRSGILKGGSVGFFSTRIIDVTDEDERNELGLGRFGFILEQNTLLEFSPATIPANPGAVALRARKHGAQGLKEHDMHVVRELARQQVRDEKQQKKWSAYEEVMLAAMKALFPAATYSFHKDMDIPVTANVKLTPETKPETKAPEQPEDQLDMEELKKLTEAIQDLAKSFGEFRSETKTAIDGFKSQLQELKTAQGETKDTPETPPEPADEVGDDMKSLFANLETLKTKFEAKETAQE